MRKVGKPAVFIVVLLIVCLAYFAFFGASNTYGDITKTYIKGVDDIRLGIDIRGGVEATFEPDTEDDITDDQMEAAETVIKLRLLAQNITDSEVYTDYTNHRVIVRFPWKENESDFNPATAVKELGETALLTFREGNEVDSTTGAPSGTTKENVILTGSDVESAEAVVLTDSNQYAVSLKLKDSGKEKFSEATGRLKGSTISIWMDETLISYPKVDSQITDGNAVITGNFTADSAKDLANRINAGALPFKLTVADYNTINASLGADALNAMILAGIIAFALIVCIMVGIYRLPGLVASVALLGQVAGSLAALSGFFPNIPSFTLTLPGIAGIILAIGIGVDANVITSERIKEELARGRTLEKAIDIGYSKAFTAVLDGNVTVLIVSVILMGAFGDPNSFFAKILSPVMGFLGTSTSGVIYSFGYTLFVGVICNLLMGVLASRLMLTSLCKFKPMRKLWMYGGKNA